MSMSIRSGPRKRSSFDCTSECTDVVHFALMLHAMQIACMLTNTSIQGKADCKASSLACRGLKSCRNLASMCRQALPSSQWTKPSLLQKRWRIPMERCAAVKWSRLRSSQRQEQAVVLVC